MPLSSGTMAVSGPTAGAKDSIAASRSYALHERITTSNDVRRSVARTVGGGGRVTSPAGLVMASPVAASRSARAGRTRNVTSRPASSSRPPKYPPVAPAPTTRKRMNGSSPESLCHDGTMPVKVFSCGI